MRVEHIGDATLYLADCMDVMRDMPDNAFELAIVDPPYGINFAKTHTGNGWTVRDSKQWDKAPPPPVYYQELFRVTKNQIIWGANYMVNSIYPSQGWIFWDKGQRNFSLADGELAFTSFDRALRVFSLSRAEALQEGKIHPTQKPVALYKWILSHYAKPGDTILDTHGGSGSSVIACLDMGHSITWIENDEDYFNAALKRIKDFAAQPKLPLDDTPEPVEQMLGFEETL